MIQFIITIFLIVIFLAIIVQLFGVVESAYLLLESIIQTIKRWIK